MAHDDFYPEWVSAATVSGDDLKTSPPGKKPWRKPGIAEVPLSAEEYRAKLKAHDWLTKLPQSIIGRGRILGMSVNPEREFGRVKDIRVKRELRLVEGNWSALIDEAELSLVLHDPYVFERADRVMRLAEVEIEISDNRKTKGLRLVEVTANNLIERFNAVRDFKVRDSRRKKDDDAWKSISCPPFFARTYLDRKGEWRLNRLRAITNCPVMRSDGSMLDMPGFDPQTGIFYDPRGVQFPHVPSAPTKEDALTAIGLIKGMISEFSFVGDAAQSVALSSILTGLMRRSLEAAPMHAFDAPTMASGKSKLANLVSMFCNGHEAPSITPGGDAMEFEKRLGSQMLAGDSVILLDNCNEAVGGELICSCLTQPIIKIRILGKSETPTIVCNFVLLATGNNFSVWGDMVRRTLICRIDPKCERPDLRIFKTEDPILVMQRERPRYVIATLTVLRAFVLAGRPKPKGYAPLGSFEQWSDLVRCCLIWLGEADPCQTIEELRKRDPEISQLGAVIDNWYQVCGVASLPLSKVIAKACEMETGHEGMPQFVHSAFRDALLSVAPGDRGIVNSKALGMWLGKQSDRVIGGKRIAKDGIASGYQLWRIELMEKVPFNG
jgi:hypothetical protein